MNSPGRDDRGCNVRRCLYGLESHPDAGFLEFFAPLPDAFLLLFGSQLDAVVRVNDAPKQLCEGHTDSCGVVGFSIARHIRV